VQLIINPADELPIYRQIMRQIIEAIAGGRLKPGDRLASHRELSEQLVIAPLTVKKAYDELEAQGYIKTQRGRGTFVSMHLPELDRADRASHLREASRRLLAEAFLAGLSLAETIRLLEEAERQLTEGPAVAQEKESK
jgi:GntR family transcriptional regulator